MATSMDTAMEDTTCSISDRASESEGVYAESDESLSKSEEVSTVPKRHDVRMLVL